MADNSAFIVRFVLRKGDGGEWPSVGELAPDEVETISSIGTFHLDFSTDYGGVDDVIIESVDVIYDGMTRLPTLEMGMHVEDGEVRGFPCPVLRLHVTGKVSPDDLARAVEGSFVRLQPASRVRNGEEPFYSEDHQGYTGILSDDSAEIIAEAARAAGAIGRTGIPFAEFSGGLSVARLNGGA